MIQVALITEEQAEEVRGVEYADSSYCNPVMDGLGRWVFSLDEAEVLGVEHEVVEWLEHDNDQLFEIE
jgi:hypothetical protein